MNKNKEQYSGISIQYGEKDFEYYSCSHISAKGIVASFLDGILKSYAVQYDRLFLSKTEE